MSKRKKILIIENSVAVTGSFHAVLRTSIALGNKFEFIFILPKGSTATNLVTENGFGLYELPLYELAKNWISVLLYIPRLMLSVLHVKNLVRKEDISIVHVNDFYNLIMPLWRLCGGSVCYLCYVNFVPNRFTFLLRKIWITSHSLFSSKIIAVSNLVLSQLPVSNKVTCIPDALPNECPKPEKVIEKKEVILFLGNFIIGKGQDLAIKAFALLAQNYPAWKLRFAGGDMGLEKNRIYKKGLQDMANELRIESQIEMTGFANDVAKEYQEASIALNFSASESFSLTVQEAMFYGCPIIATRSGGPSELIEDKYSGLLVPLADIEAMKEAIRFLIDNPLERERLKENAARSIRDKFNYEKTIGLLDRIYQDLMQKSEVI
ncbi:MAG: glycosyltransferase family 4 protein [Cyclobacteriaceae bacterium]